MTDLNVKVIVALQSYREITGGSYEKLVKWCPKSKQKAAEKILGDLNSFFMEVVLETGPPNIPLEERKIWHKKLTQFLIL